jgi:agmatinase
VAVDCGDVSMPKVSPEVARDRIYRAVREVLKAGLIPILVGGDRSMSIAATKALSDHIGAKKKMGYLHFGAHLDLADSWAGERFLAPCALARITELPNLAAKNVAHIGARNAMNPKDWIDLAKERKIEFNPMFELLKKGIYETAQAAIDRVWQGTDAQYVSFNFNVMDASDAPGVTSTEPGGIESREIMRIAEMIGKRKTISVIDVSELCPVFDVSGTAARLAVCVVTRIMASLAKERGEEIDASIRRSDLVRG